MTPEQQTPQPPANPQQPSPPAQVEPQAQAPQPAVVQPDQPSYAPQPNYAAPLPPQKKSKKKFVFAGIGILVAIFIITAITGGTVTTTDNNGNVKSYGATKAVTSAPKQDSDGQVTTGCYTFMAPGTYTLGVKSSNCYTEISSGATDATLITVTPYNDTKTTDDASAQLKQQITSDGGTVTKISPASVDGHESVRIDYTQKNGVKLAYIYIPSTAPFTYQNKTIKSFSIIAPTGTLSYDDALATVLEHFSFN